MKHIGCYDDKNIQPYLTNHNPSMPTLNNRRGREGEKANANITIITMSNGITGMTQAINLPRSHVVKAGNQMNH